MKKILFIICIIIIIITISLKVNYKAHITLSFGNNIKSNYNYLYKDTRIDDIIDDINNNKKISDRYIQNILVKSDNIYLDLNGLVIKRYDISKLNKLFETIRNFTKENVIVFLREEKNNDDKLINSWIFKIKDNYDIIIER